MDRISYRDGYRYQLANNYEILTHIFPIMPIETEYIDLLLDSFMTIKRGYAWDGPSGIAIHTKSFMRGPLVHDALYQLMREGHLDPLLYREKADQRLRDICKEDGMFFLRAEWVYLAVRMFGKGFADPKAEKQIMEAP